MANKETIPQADPNADASPILTPVVNVEPSVTTGPVSPMISVSQESWDEVQKQLKMLYEVADKGRIYNYESQRTEKKPLRVKLSVYQDKTIIGWRTIKDKAVFHPTTGKQVGEEQEYELLLLDKEGKSSLSTVHGYPNFSEARYSERVECEVTGKKEDWDGKLTFDVKLPDGRTISLDSKFVN